jgi:hypothetical protein
MVYYFQIGEQARSTGPGLFMGRDGHPVRGCHKLAPLMTFMNLRDASNYHVSKRGVFDGEILHLRHSPLDR